jgi:putative salt-induced outer membrane protein
MNRSIPFAFALLFAFPVFAQEGEGAPADPGETAPAEGEAAALEEELTPAEQEQLAPPSGQWSGEVGAGFLSTDGNSQSRSVNGKALVDYKRERWKNSFQASAVNTSATTGTSAERYQASDKVDYLFYEKNYAFVLGEYEKDLFGGTRERVSTAAGLGRHFLAGPRHVLDAEAGFGARRTEANTATRDKVDEAITRVSGKYEWKFTEKNSFSEAVKSETGETNTFTESVTQLKLAIVGNLSSTVSYTVRNNTNVPPEREKTDTETAVNLVYDFGK